MAVGEWGVRGVERGLISFDDLLGAVGRGAVDDDVAEVRIVLRHDGADGLADGGDGVAADGDDGYIGEWHECRVIYFLKSDRPFGVST